MLEGPARLIVCGFLLARATTLVEAAAPTPKDVRPAPPPSASSAVKESKPRAVSPAPAPVTTSSVPAAVAPVPITERARLRAEAEKQLRELSQITDKELTTTQSTLRDFWNQRLLLLDEWDKAAKARVSIANPSPSPEREASERKNELARATTQLEALKKSPDSVLPDVFMLPTDQIDDAKLQEMRDAIDAVKASLKEKSTQLETLRGEPAKRTASLAQFRETRDKIHTQITEQPTRRVQAEAAVFKAATEDARRVAREQLINLKCEAGLATDRLELTEGCLALEVRRGATCEVAIKAAQANVALATATLAAFTDRYKRVTERQKADLNLAAKTEEKKAQTADDPLDKYKALRTAELLSLQALNLEDDKALSTEPNVAHDEQKVLADHAEEDFAKLKQDVAENKVGGLVSLRLNNDFRRISRERAIVVRNELAQSSAANTYYENALTEAELNYFNDARDDRYERDAFIETLPKSRHAAADAMINEIEKKHRELLAQAEDVLTRLLHRAEETQAQVTRRLRILDDQYTFIRANIFWVRDTEPIGAATIGQARKESGRLFASLVKLGGQAFDRSQWTSASAEFGVGLAALIALPWLIIQGRKSLKLKLG